MTTFLTVREAAEFLGKSTSSIRRIIHPILKSDDHPDRNQIQPSVEEALQLRLKGESFGWRVSDDLLQREVSRSESTATSKGALSSHRAAKASDASLLAMLERELEIKNNQILQQAEIIAKQMQLVEGLGERIREGNILIGSLQQQLALPHPKSRPSPSDIEDAPPSAKPTKEQSKAPPRKRRGWFGW